jgi:acyl dehydratase
MNERFLEDLTVGQSFGSGRLRIDAAGSKHFAAEFDPQPFHLDEQAAPGTMFGGLAASGWHTAALTMRLLVESEFRPAGGVGCYFACGPVSIRVITTFRLTT